MHQIDLADLDSAVGSLTTEIETTRQMSANNVDGINILDLGITNPPTKVLDGNA